MRLEEQREAAIAAQHAEPIADSAGAAERRTVAVRSNGGQKPERPRGRLRAGLRTPGESRPAGGARRNVIGYIPLKRGESRPSNQATTALQRACELSGWRLVGVVTDRESDRRSLDRPGMGYALDRIAAGEAHGLVVSELKRLVRSQVDLASFLQWFRERGTALIALDLGVNTATAEGRHIADVLIALGEWERHRIAERTKRGLADAKANGRPLGRPSINDRPDLRAHIRAMRVSGMTLQAIADTLDAEGVATLRGGARWRPSSVQAALGYRRPGSQLIRAGATRVPSGPEPEGCAAERPVPRSR
jgi:DNA invertase Pin-like site-specific DNA recombinase